MRRPPPAFEPGDHHGSAMSGFVDKLKAYDFLPGPVKGQMGVQVQCLFVRNEYGDACERGRLNTCLGRIVDVFSVPSGGGVGRRCTCADVDG